MVCLCHVHFQKYLCLSCQQSVKIYKNRFMCKDASFGRQNMMILEQSWLGACSFLFCFLIIYCFPFLFGKLSICFKLGFCEVGNKTSRSPGPCSVGMGLLAMEGQFPLDAQVPVLPHGQHYPWCHPPPGTMDICVCPLTASAAC